MRTKIMAYGYLGWEMQIGMHIKTRVIFALTDEKKKRLAWYTFAQDKVVPHWQGDFDRATIGDKKLDRNEPFAETHLGPPLPYQYPFQFQISDLAPLLGTSAPVFATLDMFDYNPLGVTSCSIRTKAKGRDIYFGFDMKMIQKRRTFDIRKTGRLYGLGTERFSLKAIEDGPPRTSHDPLAPHW